MYNVLWIDDQYNDPEMIQFAIEAENNGLILEGYKSSEEGFIALENKFEHFDLILLDGLFFEKKDQEIGTEDEYGIGSAIGKINELKARKIFPWFVLSGKDKFTKGENILLKANKAECYDKTNPSDVLRLFEDMSFAASKQPDTQLKHKYSDLLEICSDNLIGNDNYSRLIDLIKHIENDTKITGGEDMLISMRKIIEGLFSTLGKYQIIPIEIVGAKGWINGSSLFLSGKHSDYKINEEIIPSIIALNIHKLLIVLQDGSHAYGDLKYKVDSYIKNSEYDYFLRSCIYSLFDLLVYFKTFIDDNSDKTINQTKWKLIDINKNIFEGVISQDINGNYHCEHYYLNYNFVHDNYNVGDKILITQESLNTNQKTMNDYSHYASKFKKIS